MNLPGRKKRAGVALNLTPMIDVFAILILYLIVGTAFGPSLIKIPPEIQLPISPNQDPVEPATSIIVGAQKITFEPTGFTTSHSHFADQAPPFFRNWIAKNKKKGEPLLIHFVAGQELPYRMVYAISNVLQNAGFDYVQFVTKGE